jgi:hypothetical protein
MLAQRGLIGGVAAIVVRTSKHQATTTCPILHKLLQVTPNPTSNNSLTLPSIKSYPFPTTMDLPDEPSLNIALVLLPLLLLVVFVVILFVADDVPLPSSTAHPRHHHPHSWPQEELTALRKRVHRQGERIYLNDLNAVNSDTGLRKTVDKLERDMRVDRDMNDALLDLCGKKKAERVNAHLDDLKACTDLLEENVERMDARLNTRLDDLTDGMMHKNVGLHARLKLYIQWVGKLRFDVDGTVVPAIDELDTRVRELEKRADEDELWKGMMRDMIREEECTNEVWVNIIRELGREVERLAAEDEEVAEQHRDGEEDDENDEQDDEGYGDGAGGYEDTYGDQGGSRDEDEQEHNQEHRDWNRYEHWNWDEHEEHDTEEHIRRDHGRQDAIGDAASRKVEDGPCTEPNALPSMRADSPMLFIHGHFAPDGLQQPMIQNEQLRLIRHPWRPEPGKLEALETTSREDENNADLDKGEMEKENTCDCHYVYDGTRSQHVDPSPGTPEPDPTLPFLEFPDPDHGERDMCLARRMFEEEQAMPVDYEDIYNDSQFQRKHSPTNATQEFQPSLRGGADTIAMLINMNCELEAQQRLERRARVVMEYYDRKFYKNAEKAYEICLYWLQEKREDALRRRREAGPIFRAEQWRQPVAGLVLQGDVNSGGLQTPTIANRQARYRMNGSSMRPWRGTFDGGAVGRNVSVLVGAPLRLRNRIPRDRAGCGWSRVALVVVSD